MADKRSFTPIDEMISSGQGMVEKCQERIRSLPDMFEILDAALDSLRQDVARKQKTERGMRYLIKSEEPHMRALERTRDARKRLPGSGLPILKRLRSLIRGFIR